MLAKKLGKTLNTRELQSLLRPLRELDNFTNLVYLAIDYLSLAAVILPTVFFLHYRQSWGLAWGWNVPVAAVAITLIGALQHRLAGLGHEASHYVLLKNKFANELVSDLFCMFPIFATTHQYRLVHMAHHQYTNDWEKDPDLTNIGASKLMDQFPMSRWRFIYNYFIRFFLPHVLLRYLWDIIYLSAFGRGISPYQERRARETPNAVNVSFRPTSLLGIAYIGGLILAMASFNKTGAFWPLLTVPPLALTVATAVIQLLPASAFFDSPLKGIYSIKFTNTIRLAYYTALFWGFAWARYFTGVNFGAYFLLLWAVPIFTSFAYFMLLRDVYQHANADDGKLTNTRVFFTDAFTRWSVFVYGMDIHVPHHVYPAIPHYNLPKAHSLLMSHCPEYATHVVECHGTFHNGQGRPTILDTMRTPTVEPPDETESHPHATPDLAAIRA